MAINWEDVYKTFMTPREETNWGRFMSVMPTVVGGVGSYLDARAAGESTTEGLYSDFLARQEAREDARRMAQASMMSDFLNNRQTMANTGLASTQMNPFVANEARGRLELANLFGRGLSDYTIGPDMRGSGGFNIPAGGLNIPAVSPAALNQAQEQFNRYRVGADPFTSIVGGTDATEQQRQQNLNALTTTQGDVMNFLSQQGQGTSRVDPVTGRYVDPVSGRSLLPGQSRGLNPPQGMPWWKKLALGASFALPFVGPIAGAFGAGLGGFGTALGWGGGAGGALMGAGLGGLARGWGGMAGGALSGYQAGRNYNPYSYGNTLRGSEVSGLAASPVNIPEGIFRDPNANVIPGMGWMGW